MEGYRLSPQQRQLLGTLGENAPWANRCCVDIRGPLDLNGLEQCLVALLRSEEILRTYYPCFSGVRVQAIADEPVWTGLELVDLSLLDADEQQNRIRGHDLRLESSIPEGPSEVFKAAVVKLGPEHHVLVFSCIALNGDAASHGLLARRVARLYAAGGRREGATASEYPQYADLAEWCNSLLESPDAVRGRQYWREIVADGLIEPEVLPEAPAAAVSSFLPARTASPFCEGLLEVVDELAASLGIERRDVMAAAWAALLWRLNGSQAYSLGVHSDGRGYAELEESLGLLTRLLPMPVTCDSAMRFSELARRLAEKRGELAARQGYLDWPRTLDDESTAPGVDVLRVGYAYVDAAWQETAAGTSFGVRDLACHEQPFLLKLAVLAGRERLGADVWFDASRVDPEAAENMAARLQLLLEHAAREPHAAVGSLEVLAPQDWRALRTNVAANVPAVAESSLLSRINGVAIARPDAPAVSCGGVTLSYAELTERSDRLAGFLLRNGTAPGTRVGICMTRSPDVIVAILAVLKAGSAYVPLDPEYPVERLRYVLEDSGARVLLTQETLLAKLSDVAAEIVCLDGGDARITGSPPALPEPVGGVSDGIAYLLYTSGSTGRPKGVTVTWSNLAYSTAARFAFYEEAPETFLLLSSFSFDSSVAGIFWTLAGGGHLVFPGGDAVLDPGEISMLVSTHAVTHTLCLPSVHSLLLDTVGADVLSSLRHVIVAGESCPAALVDKHARILPHARFFNEYGPTECTVWCIACECGSMHAGGVVPIGTAIPGTTALVLDPNAKPLPIGCKGELYIAGPGVTAGYWRRPDLTEERFVDVEVPGVGRARAYRTGDLARSRPDGNLEFLGRVDFQVKINGYRIELEEVENAIRAIPGVHDAAVVVRGTVAGDRQLAAFLRLGASAELADIETRLEDALPSYMIPSLLTAVADFPRMPNGKVDRRALSTTPVEKSARYVAPRDHLEALQAELWEDLLKRERIGIEDDFFRLGGHSIVATRLIARLKDMLQLSIPIRLLFEHSTIASFTEALRTDESLGPRLPRIEVVLAAVADIADEDLDDRASRLT
jgi:amino acid adenylation domain-containing protein